MDKIAILTRDCAGVNASIRSVVRTAFYHTIEVVGVLKGYDVNLGDPIGQYYKKDNAYWREFEKGIIVSSPYENVKGDGRIYIKGI